MPNTATLLTHVGTPSANIGERSQRLVARTVNRVLRVSLSAKLIGANLVIVACAVFAALVLERRGASEPSVISALVVGLVIGTTVNVLLTRIALQPLRDIEKTVKRMWRGEPRPRVEASPVADPDLDSVGATINALLDHVERDRVAMRELAAEVVRAEDRERDRIARQLHESIAQSLASVTYQLTAAATECGDPRAAQRIQAVRLLAGEVLDEVDVLSHTIHPRVLNDLGLYPGLSAFARDKSTPEVPIIVHLSSGTADDLRGLGSETSSALFRIAQEAVQNALRHSGASRIDISVGVANHRLTLCITDNGKGFDVHEAERRRPGMGLFTMQQRAALINAHLTIDAELRGGATVEVTMPVGPATLTANSSQTTTCQAM